jgi:hypothetical protein
MTTWKVTNRATGETIHAYTADEPYPFEGMGFDVCNHIAEVAQVEQSSPVRRLTKLAFIGRIGDEFAGILTAAKSNVQVELFVRMLDWATPDPDGTSVDLDDPRVVDALTTLEAAGLIGAGRALEIRA